jgi:beta-glucosidase-like glycosyl hydrolase
VLAISLPSTIISISPVEDSPLGVRFADSVPVFPAAITGSQAGWDNRRWKRSLLRTRGVAMGIIALGPMMNIGRVTQGGCNWEGFGADPFLAGVGAYEAILDMQSAGVQACAKHYIHKGEIFRSVAATH